MVASFPAADALRFSRFFLQNTTRYLAPTTSIVGSNLLGFTTKATDVSDTLPST